MLKQDYVPRVTQVLSKSHSWRWPISHVASTNVSFDIQWFHKTQIKKTGCHHSLPRKLPRKFPGS